MATATGKHHYLSFIEAKGHFKWTGSEHDLKLLVHEATDEATDGNWEEDPHHNMLSFKSKDTVIKWYRGTKTLMVQGSKHMECKVKLHGVLESEIRAHESVDERPTVTGTPGEVDQPQVTKCNCGCKAVLETLKKLELSVAELQVKIVGDTSPQNTNNQMDAEVKYLRERCIELEEQNCTLIHANECLRERVATMEAERESL